MGSGGAIRVGVEATRAERGRPAADMQVQAAILSAMAAARAAGAGRSCLTGLWLAAVSTLVEAGDPADVMAVLLDRASSIRGYGRNADAPALAEDAEARERRAADARVAAQAIVEALAPLPQAEADEFPETLLDAALALLAEAWGPVHVRRALWDQRASIEAGSDAVILPVEPAASNGASRRAAAPEPAPAAPEAQAVPARPPEATPAVPDAGPRSVEVHADAAALPGGRVVYAACARIVSGGTREVRELTGAAPGLSLRHAAVLAVAEVLAGLAPGGGDAVRVSTPVEGAVRAARSADGDGLSAPLARVGLGRSVEWRHVSGALGSDLARRCDRALRDRVDEESSAAA